MLASLDALGRLKWPSLLAITALPVASWFLGWRDWDRGIGAAIYGPRPIAGVSLVLAHHAGSDPRRDSAVTWFARACADCEPRLKRLQLAYGDCLRTPTHWTEATGSAGRLSAVLKRGDGACLWARATSGDGRTESAHWPLDGALGP